MVAICYKFAVADAVQGITMAKSKNTFQCDECGALLGKWAGQCPECLAWNCIAEAQAAVDRPRRYGGGFSGQTENKVHDLAGLSESDQQRIKINISELDRVLGGGLVPGSVLLLGGDPGIGKSTLLLQLTSALAGRLSSLYVTGEESLDQVSMRARRLGLELQGIR